MHEYTRQCSKFILKSSIFSLFHVTSFLRLFDAQYFLTF